MKDIGKVPAGRGQRQRFKWSNLLWALVFPQRRQRVTPTIPGVVLVALALGIGTAAYNAANNILFIALALLLACLVLSGILSWLNFRRVDWSLELSPPLRAGEVAVATLIVRNSKRLLPTYGLSFDLVARIVERTSVVKPESTFTARGIDVRAALARIDVVEAKGRIALRTRLDPGETARLEWNFTPTRRGMLKVQLEGIISQFPFGFLKKQIRANLEQQAIVWPEPIEYRADAVAVLRRTGGDDRMRRLGGGNDLLGLRRYAQGDSHRSIHWKASARARKLLVRQFAAESSDGFSLWLSIDRGIWTKPEQFELLLRFAGSLAEDLFRAGKLLSLAVDSDAPVAARRVRDVESFLDRVAAIDSVDPAISVRQQPAAHERGYRTPLSGGRNVIVFTPDGPRGISAWVDGHKLAGV